MRYGTFKCWLWGHEFKTDCPNVPNWACLFKYKHRVFTQLCVRCAKPLPRQL